MSTTGKSTKNQSRLVVLWGSGRERRAQGVTIKWIQGFLLEINWGNKNVLELDSGNGCTTP